MAKHNNRDFTAEETQSHPAATPLLSNGCGWQKRQITGNFAPFAGIVDPSRCHQHDINTFTYFNKCAICNSWVNVAYQRCNVVVIAVVIINIIIILTTSSSSSPYDVGYSGPSKRPLGTKHSICGSPTLPHNWL